MSGFQLRFSSDRVYTPGDACDVLVAMNAAALKVNLKGLKKGGKIIANLEGFDAKNLRLAAYPEGINPLEDGSLDSFEVIKELGKIEAFGENALLENTKRIYTAIVATDQAELMVIPHFAIQEVFDSNPKIKAKVMTSLAEYYNENNRRLFKSYKNSFGFFNLGEMFETPQ